MSEKLDHDKRGEEEEAFITTTNYSKKNAAKFFLNGILPNTSLARTLAYEKLLPESPHCATPTVLAQLLNELDRKTPPLERLLSGMTQETLKQADALLTCLVTDDKRREFGPLLIKSLPSGILVQMVQILFLRFQEPVFFASSALCNYVHNSAYMLNPRSGVCRSETTRASANGGHKFVAACMDHMKPQQQAVTATVIKFCQKWCRAHLGYMMHKHGHNDSNLEYAEAISFLSSLFASCLIGVPQGYVALRHMGSDFGSVAALKRDIFIYLLNTVTQERWHMLAMRSMGVDISGWDDEDDKEKHNMETNLSRDVSVDEDNDDRQLRTATMLSGVARRNFSFSWV